MIIDPKVRKQIENCLWRGDMLEAIRILRLHSGWDLGTAKGFVESYKEEISKLHPELINVPVLPPPLPLNRDVLDQLRPITSGDIKAFLKVLTHLEKHLYGWNYEIGLEASVFELNSENLFLAEVISKCYSLSVPRQGCFYPAKALDAKKEIEACLRFEGDRGAGIDLSGEKGEVLNHILIPKMWDHFERILKFDSIDAYAYSQEDGMPMSVLWGFRYIFHDQANRRYLVFTGGASD